MKSSEKLTHFLIITGILLSTLYGTTYQQFLHFHPSDPIGTNDSVSYLAMLHKDYNVSPIHRYRFITPLLASLLEPLGRIMPKKPEMKDQFSFYVVNFCFAFLTSLLLFIILRRLGFDTCLSLLGSLFFNTSRAVVQAVGTPLVDAAYYLAISIIILLIQTSSTRLFCVLSPILVLTKETVMPFLFLPLLRRDMRNKWVYISLGLSVVVFYVARAYIDRLAAVPPESNVSFLDIVVVQVLAVEAVLRQVVSFKGLVDATNSFSFLFILAIVGFVVNRRSKKYSIPNYLLMTIPISVVFAALSGNVGRMLFSAYVVVIAYSLICIEYYIFNVISSKMPK